LRNPKVSHEPSLKLALLIKEWDLRDVAIEIARGLGSATLEKIVEVSSYSLQDYNGQMSLGKRLDLGH